MKQTQTPQEKKHLSYKKDCRDNYGENDKSSRKSIKRRKRWVNQSYRRTIKQKIPVNLLSATINKDEEQIVQMEFEIKKVRRKFWKKSSDKPLGLYLKEKKNFKDSDFSSETITQNLLGERFFKKNM